MKIYFNPTAEENNLRKSDRILQQKTIFVIIIEHLTQAEKIKK